MELRDFADGLLPSDFFRLNEEALRDAFIA